MSIHGAAGRGIVLALALGACGPIGYANDVARTANNAVEEARAVDAANHAPYWWTRAVEYLHKARELGARADFQGANRFGRLATDAAQHATEEAHRGDSHIE